MTTELGGITEQTEVVVEEPQVPAEEITPEEQPEEEVDWKSRAEQAEARALAAEEAKTKTDHQLSTNQGILKQRLDTEAELAKLRREGTATRELVEALVNRTASGDTVPLAGDVAQIREKQVQGEQQEAYREVWETSLRDLRTEADFLKLSLDEAPEFAGTRALWNQTVNMDPANPAYRKLMHQAVAEARRVGRQIQQDRHEAEIREAKEDATERMKKAGVLTTPPNPQAAGRGGRTDQDLVNRLGWGEQMTVDEMQKAQQAMDKGIYPEAKPK